MKYCRRCIAVSEARWSVRRLSFGAMLCSWSVEVVGEVHRVRGSGSALLHSLGFVVLFSMSSCTGVAR